MEGAAGAEGVAGGIGTPAQALSSRARVAATGEVDFMRGKAWPDPDCCSAPAPAVLAPASNPLSFYGGVFTFDIIIGEHPRDRSTSCADGRTDTRGRRNG